MMGVKCVVDSSTSTLKLQSSKTWPRGSKYPILKGSGSKDHPLHGFWDQSPQILGAWTLWVGLCGASILLSEKSSFLGFLGWSLQKRLNLSFLDGWRTEQWKNRHHVLGRYPLYLHVHMSFYLIYIYIYIDMYIYTGIHIMYVYIYILRIYIHRHMWVHPWTLRGRFCTTQQVASPPTRSAVLRGLLFWLFKGVVMDRVF